jgi:hypothetical protein
MSSVAVVGMAYKRAIATAYTLIETSKLFVENADFENGIFIVCFLRFLLS